MRCSRVVCNVSADLRSKALKPSSWRLASVEDRQSELCGWVRSLRSHKKVAFAEIDDGSGATVQAVLKGDTRDGGLTPGAAVHLSGEYKASRGSGQDVEFVVSETKVLGSCDESYPIQKKSLPQSILREHAHLRFKTSSTAATMRLRHALERDWHDWFDANDFVHIHTPILTSSDCEGAGEVFTVAQSLPTSPPAPPPFFPKPANLTVSGQLHLEAPTHGMSKVYTLSPCFRAEPSQTSRHLAEFYMLEAEIAFVTSLTQLCDVVEDGVQAMLARLLDSAERREVRAREDIALVAEYALEGVQQPDALQHIKSARQPFARVSYTEAIDILSEQHQKSPFQHQPVWSDGLTSEQEKWLAGEHFGRPVFVMDYPAAMKPFYMLPSETQIGPEPTVAAFDLLFPGIGEMAGGSLREHRLDALLVAIQKAGLKQEDYDWYLDLRRFGSAPHGGWGMGFDRWVCWVAGIANIRDVVPFPRWAGSCRF